MRRFVALLAAAALVGGVSAGSALANGSTTAARTPGPSSSNWVPTLPLSQQSRQILSAFPNGTGYVFDVGSQAISLWHTADFGLVWDVLTYLPAGVTGFSQARFTTPKVGYMMNFDTILTTTDGATAPDWKALPGPRLPKGDSFFATALGVVGATVGFGGELYGPLHLGCNEPISQNLWTSHDNAHTWLSAPLPRNEYVSQVHYLNATDAVAIAYDLQPDGNPCEYIGATTSIYVTHDGGRHFRNVLHCAGKSGELCTSALFLDPRHLILGRNDGTLVLSSDGGRSFRPGPDLPTILGAQPTKSHNDADFWVQGFATAGRTLYATTKFAGAYLSTDGGVTWSHEYTCDSAYTLGIGEVAAFDSQRAIAGGPTCISTRLGGGQSGDVGVAGPVIGSGIDFQASAGGLTERVVGGRLTVLRRRH